MLVSPTVETKDYIILRLPPRRLTHAAGRRRFWGECPPEGKGRDPHQVWAPLTGNVGQVIVKRRKIGAFFRINGTGLT